MKLMKHMFTLSIHLSLLILCSSMVYGDSSAGLKLKNQTSQNQNPQISLPLMITEDHLNFSVTAKQPVFTIQLKSNPSTGYTWFLREYNSHLILPVVHSFRAPNKKLMGAVGEELWTFRVKPEGFVVPHQTIIRMIYARPWQGSGNAVQAVFRISTSEHL